MRLALCTEWSRSKLKEMGLQLFRRDTHAGHLEYTSRKALVLSSIRFDLVLHTPLLGKTLSHLEPVVGLAVPVLELLVLLSAEGSQFG